MPFGVESETGAELWSSFCTKHTTSLWHAHIPDFFTLSLTPCQHRLGLWLI